MDKKIVATFQYGGRFSPVKRFVFYAALVLMPICAIVCFIGSFVFHPMFAAFAVMSLGLCIPILWFVKVDIKYKKLIEEWIKDVVLVKARMVEATPLLSGNGYVNHASFIIAFYYEGEKIVLNNDTTFPENQKIKQVLSYISYKELRNFTDRDIDVYYSPSYKQILFFK